ncbi:transposase [Croceibacterium sp. TMG7-5b_MA50]|uniref:transposase n=1 Tax=Croceibacterium sp. TMG7-5b_MA50 TaxID=3121290 RepID=UPI003221A8A0
MPRVIDRAELATPTAAPCALDECIDGMEAQGFDPQDEGSLLGAAHWLARLGGNGDFLAEVMLAELGRRHRSEEAHHTYGPQVIMLSPLGRPFFLRAAIWPSADEHMFRASGGGAFVYELPHDHNFDFLTYGYFGPGYASDYYEYDYEEVAGAIGEKAGLRFTERAQLTPGKIMHYRAHRDVHSQLPPAGLSVSLNIMHAGGAQGWTDQYRFKVDDDEIDGILSPGSSEVFLRIAVGLGGGEALDLAERFAARHPSDRMRLTALEAQAGMLDHIAADDLWRRAEGSGSRLVALEAVRHRRELAVRQALPAV